MTFTESIQTCFKKWRTVKGTASRSEFWFFSLFIALVAIPLVILFFVTAGNTGDHSSGTAGLLVFGVLILFYICVLPASICVTVRRLHDIGKPGTYYFVSFIPYVGSAILLYFLVLPTKEDSPYREDKVNLLDEWNKEAEL